MLAPAKGLRSAGDVQDCIGSSGFFFQFLDGLFRREDHKSSGAQLLA